MRSAFIITCDLTRVERPAYFVCDHVLRGAEIWDVKPATADAMGFIVCMPCALGDAPVDGLRTCCAECIEATILNGNKVGHA
jgi:hypothetical protein